MNYKNKGGFTFVEMIIAISIVVLLAVVGNGSLSTYKEKSNNSKVISDLSTLNNSLLSYSTENTKLPKAGGNNNFFKLDTSYAHSWTGTDTFGAHGFITENTLPNKYLNYLPLDPVTGQYYAYGRTKIDLQFEVAGVILKDSQPVSLVNGNYAAENGPYNLIREYNGPDFVYDKSTSVFPYNPYEKVLTAKISDFSGSYLSIKINNLTMGSGELLSYTLKTGDNIYVSTGSTVDLYFSDGTTATLGDMSRKSELTLSDMSFNGKTNLFTKVKLVLGVGTIWSNATSLGSDSSFEIYTTDSSAAVRGTIFGISKDLLSTNVSVIDGNVNVKNLDNSNSLNVPIGKFINGITPSAGANLSLSSGFSSVSSSTLDRVGKLANSIQLNINYYRKTTNLIDIKLKLNNIIKKKAEYLKLRVGNTDYKLKNNWSHLRELTLTGGTIFDINTFFGIIQQKPIISLSFCGNRAGKTVCTKDKTIKIIDGKYKLADIQKCPKGTKKFNHECIVEPIGVLKDWELVAYAPYDEVGDINMYNEEGKKFNVTNNYIMSNGQTTTTLTCNNGFCTTSTGIKGVYINTGSTDFINYSGQTLPKDFAIEMSVKGLTGTTINTLFDIGGNILRKNEAGFLSFVYGNNKNSTGSLNNTTNGFDKIIFKKIRNNIEISINGSGSISMSNGPYINSSDINYIYIGSKKGGFTPQQWNNIIDYVKIYKK